MPRLFGWHALSAAFGGVVIGLDDDRDEWGMGHGARDGGMAATRQPWLSLQ